MNEETIRLAIRGDEDALSRILGVYKSYIRTLSWDNGEYNKELEGELTTALLMAILKFKIS